jgi:hypothetical protein
MTITVRIVNAAIASWHDHLLSDDDLWALLREIERTKRGSK